MNLKSKLNIFLLILLVTCSIFFRTYRYSDVSLDYDEHKTIYSELKNTSFHSIMNYLLLKNAFNYQSINSTGTEVGEQLNICFPFYYLFLKLAVLIRHDIAFLRLFTSLFGILTPIIMFFIGRRYNLQVGLCATLLVLFHPWAQHHSMHIRFYECWALLSALGLWYVEYFLEKIRLKKTRIWHMILLAIILLLPCTVHAFGVLTTIFMAIMIITTMISEHLSLHRIPKTQLFLFCLIVLISTVITSVNLLVFAYASVFENHPSYTQNSESAIHIFISTIFNFGYFYIGMIGLFIVSALTNWKQLPLPLKRYGIAFLGSSIFGLVVVVKPQAFRPDFFYGMLPSLCLLLSLCFDYLTQSWFSTAFVKRGALIVTFTLILSNFPTFISNVFIDFDRINFYEAAQVASKLNDNAVIYAPNHNYFNAYLKTNIVQPISKMNPEHGLTNQDEYFFIGMRKGKSMQFFYDVTKLHNVQLIQILGKSRLDLRANHVFIFYRRCKKKS